MENSVEDTNRNNKSCNESPEKIKFEEPSTSSTPLSPEHLYTSTEEPSQFIELSTAGEDSDSSGELFIDEHNSSLSDDETLKNVEKPSAKRALKFPPRSRGLGLDALPYTIKDVPVIYHKNMARQFPNTIVRSIEEQIVRDKNTEAARHSRAKSKVIFKLIRTDADDTTIENVNGKRTVAAQRNYANLLLKVLEKEERNWRQEFNDRSDSDDCEEWHEEDSGTE